MANYVTTLTGAQVEDKLSRSPKGFIAERAGTDQAAFTAETTILFNSLVEDTTGLGSPAYDVATGIYTVPAEHDGCWATFSVNIRTAGFFNRSGSLFMKGTPSGGSDRVFSGSIWDTVNLIAGSFSTRLAEGDTYYVRMVWGTSTGINARNDTCFRVVIFDAL